MLLAVPKVIFFIDFKLFRCFGRSIWIRTCCTFKVKKVFFLIVLNYGIIFSYSSMKNWKKNNSYDLNIRKNKGTQENFFTFVELIKIIDILVDTYLIYFTKFTFQFLQRCRCTNHNLSLARQLLSNCAIGSMKLTYLDLR